MAEFVPVFEGQISPNFGYLYTYDDVKELIKQYEAATISRFVDLKTDRTFARGLWITSSKGKSVCWQTFASQSASVPGASMKYDGVPFLLVGVKSLDCHRGKDRRESQKKRLKEKHRQIQGDALKPRMLKQPTKKLDCPARMIIKEVLRFPEFKIDEDKQFKRKIASKKLRQALDSDDPPKGERRFYLYLPTKEDHAGTHEIQEMDGDRQRLDSRVIDKIHEVVGVYGRRTPAEMELILRFFVKDKLGLEPHEGNRRFFPRRSDIRYHMNVAEKCLTKRAKNHGNQNQDNQEPQLAVDALIADCERELQVDQQRQHQDEQQRQHQDKRQFLSRKSDQHIPSGIKRKTGNTSTHLHSKPKRKKPENPTQQAMMAKIKQLEKTVQEQQNVIDQMNTVAHIKLVLSQVLPDDSFRMVVNEIDNAMISRT